MKGSDNAPPLEHITLSLSTLNFTPTYPGFPRDILLSIQNTGQLDSTVTLSDLPASPFSVTSVPGSPAVLSAQDIMQVTIRFTPTPGVETSYGDTMEITTSAGDTPLFLLPVSGTATNGAATIHPIGNLDSVLSLPSKHDNDDVVFVSNDQLVRFDAGSNLTFIMTAPEITNIIQPALGRVGSRKVLLATSGIDATVGTKDDTLVLVEVQAGSFSTQSVVVGSEDQVGATEGGLSSNPIARPVRLGENGAAVITTGKDSVWGSADDTVTFVNFSAGTFVHEEIGFLDPLNSTCRLNGDDGQIVTVGSPGSDGLWGDLNDTVHWLQYNAGANTVSAASMTGIPGGLDQTLSEIIPRASAKALYMRPGPTIPGMGNADDELVEIEAGQLETALLTLPNIVGMFTSLGSSEIAVPVQDLGSSAIQYVVLFPETEILTLQGTPAAMPNVDLSTLVSAFRTTNLFDENSGLFVGAQLFGIELGSGVLDYLEIGLPSVGPLPLETITVGTLDVAATPAIFDNAEWAALTLSPSNEVAICGFRESIPLLGTFPVSGLQASLLSRAVTVGNSVVVVLTDGGDGNLADGNNSLVRIDFPIP